MPHWKTMMGKPYLGWFDLVDLPRKEITLTIHHIEMHQVPNRSGEKQDRAIAFFSEPGTKPMILNDTNGKIMESLAHSGEANDWTGLRIIVFATKTPVGKVMEDCLRIRPFLAKPLQAAPTPTEPVKCADCGKAILEHTTPSGKVFTAHQITQTSIKKFNRPLCLDCGLKASTTTEQPEGDATNDSTE